MGLPLKEATPTVHDYYPLVNKLAKLEFENRRLGFEFSYTLEAIIYLDLDFSDGA